MPAITRIGLQTALRMDPLAAVPVSTLCDVDKSLPVVDPALRPLTTRTLCGPAYTVVAAGEFLSVLYAIGEAAPGDVLVIQAGGAPLAALGELLATWAWRRGLRRDRRRRLRPRPDRAAAGPAPVGARHRPDGGPQRRRAARRRPDRAVGGVRVTPGDLVIADDDGIVIAPRAQLEACLERAEAIERTEAAVLGELQSGASLADMTNLADHVAALRRGRARSRSPRRPERRVRDARAPQAAAPNSKSTSPRVKESPSPSKTMRVMPLAPLARSSSGLGASGSFDQS